MTRNQRDAAVAARLGCTAAYVTQVRLNPDRFKSELAKKIKTELDRMEQSYERFRREVLQPA